MLNIRSSERIRNIKCVNVQPEIQKERERNSLHTSTLTVSDTMRWDPESKEQIGRYLKSTIRNAVKMPGYDTHLYAQVVKWDSSLIRA